MLSKIVGRMASPLARSLQKGHMRKLGISNGMRLARFYYRLRYHKHNSYRKAAYQREFVELIRENGEPRSDVPQMKDGFFLDTALSNPHLPRLLEETEQIIAERGQVRRSEPGAYRSFFQNLVSPEDVERYPSILDFALSSEVLSVVCKYLECIPSLSRVHPPGVRLAESYEGFDDHPDSPHDSQLFHMDYYSKPCVYVIVLLHDVSMDHGPFCFLPASISREVTAGLKYWSRGKPYRLSDEEIYSRANESDVIRMTYPRGTALYIDPSACLHFGSRNSVQPRYLLMLGYTTAIRTDFGEFYLEPYVYAGGTGDSRLKRMVLDRNYLG